MKIFTTLSNSIFLIILCMTPILDSAATRESIKTTNGSTPIRKNSEQKNKYSERKQSHAEESESNIVQREDIVMLLQGKNALGEDVYSYVKISVNNLRLMKYSILNKEEFEPLDYGEVIASGQGKPSPELREEMRQKYGMMSAPK